MRQRDSYMCAGRGMAVMSERRLRHLAISSPKPAMPMNMENSWSCLFAVSLQEHDAIVLTMSKPHKLFMFKRNT